MMSRLLVRVSTQARFNSESSGLLLLGHGWRPRAYYTDNNPTLRGDHARSKCGGTFALVIECCLRAIVAMLTNAYGLASGGHSMPAILKRLATVIVLLATTLFLLTASGGSYTRDELLLDIQKTIK